MAFISFYNSNIPEIRQTIVLNVNNDDIPKFECSAFPPKPYFHYNFGYEMSCFKKISNIRNSYSVKCLQDMCNERNLIKTGNKNHLKSRLVIDELGLRYHKNGKLYQKMIPKHGYIHIPRNVLFIDESSINHEILKNKIHSDYLKEKLMNPEIKLNTLNILSSVDIGKLNSYSMIEKYGLEADEVLQEWRCDETVIFQYHHLEDSKPKSTNYIPSSILNSEYLNKVEIKYPVFSLNENNSERVIKYNSILLDIANIGISNHLINTSITINYFNNTIYKGQFKTILFVHFAKVVGIKFKYYDSNQDKDCLEIYDLIQTLSININDRIELIQDYNLFEKDENKPLDGELFQPNGYGEMFYSNGANYKGMFNSGKRTIGKYIYSENNTKLSYEGEYKEHGRLPNGLGKLIFKNGDVYEGNFKKGRYHGTGKLTTQEYIYEGKFIDGMKWGRGNITYKDGTNYTGIWYKNMMDGSGVLSHKDGEKYEGEFFENQYQGSGKLIYSTGEIYEGNFNESLFDGSGTYIYSNKVVYKGHWSKGIREGYGMLTHPNGNHYTGYFNNNKFSKKGSIVIKNPCLNQEFKSLEYNKNNKNNMISIDGNIIDDTSTDLSNESKLSIMDGSDVKIVYGDGIIFEGAVIINGNKQIKINDLLTNHSFSIYFDQNTENKLTYDDKSMFKGYFKDNYPIGNGKLILTDESFLEGNWDLKNEPTFVSYTDVNSNVYSSKDCTFKLEKIKDTIQGKESTIVSCNGKLNIPISLSNKKSKLIDKSAFNDIITCPITGEIMKEPVLCIIDKTTYEKCAIERWINEKHTSPMTRETINLDSLVDNRIISNFIEFINVSNNN